MTKMWMARIATGAVVVAAGFVVLAVAWHRTSARRIAPLQGPELVSGGIVGLALIGVGLAVAFVAVIKTGGEGEARELDALLAEATALVVSRRQPGGPDQKRERTASTTTSG